MKALDPYDLRCAVCNKAFSNTDIVGIVDIPGGHVGAVHLDHTGMRNLIEHPSQITTGALLKTVAEAFDGETTSEEAFARFQTEHDKLTAVQRARIKRMAEP